MIVGFVYPFSFPSFDLTLRNIVKVLRIESVVWTEGAKGGRGRKTENYEKNRSEKRWIRKQKRNLNCFFFAFFNRLVSFDFFCSNLKRIEGNVGESFFFSFFPRMNVKYWLFSDSGFLYLLVSPFRSHSLSLSLPIWFCVCADLLQCQPTIHQCNEKSCLG